MSEANCSAPDPRLSPAEEGSPSEESELTSPATLASLPSAVSPWLGALRFDETGLAEALGDSHSAAFFGHDLMSCELWKQIPQTCSPLTHLFNFKGLLHVPR